MKKFLSRFISEKTLDSIEAGVKNPKPWLRGDGLPADHITPWELMLYFFNKAFGDMSGGFTSKQDFLYKEVYRIPANKISIAGVVSSVWDAVNDPILGSWMDRKRFAPSVLRKILRISAVTGSILAVVKLFDGNMSVWGHLGLLMLCNMSQDIVSTLAGVSDQKMRAGISPSSQQRGRIRVWENLGNALTWPIGNLPTVLMGFSSQLGLSDYQIIFWGACILLPFAITAHILPSFVRQRVDFSVAAAEQQEQVSLRERLNETYQVIRHNRYFLLNSLASFITVFSPDMGDELIIYRYLMPSFKFFRWEVGGEALLPIKQMLSGTLSNILQPFHRQIINKVGGPLRAQQLKCLVNIASKLLMYLFGYKSLWRFALLIVFESFVNASGGFDGVAGAMMDYQWYDYVELKTGQRSEGITAAVNSLFSKIVTNNIGQVTGNAFLQWTGYQGGYKADGTRPPERYLKFMWPMYTLIPVLDHSIWFAARSFVKWKPEDAVRTELALAERRAAAELLKEEVEIE